MYIYIYHYHYISVYVSHEYKYPPVKNLQFFPPVQSLAQLPGRPHFSQLELHFIPIGRLGLARQTSRRAMPGLPKPQKKP